MRAEVSCAMDGATLATLVTPATENRSRPLGVQHLATEAVERADPECVRRTLEGLLLPTAIRDMYTALQSVENEFYLGPITFRSLRSMAADLVGAHFAIAYGGAQEAILYEHDSCDGLVLRRFRGEVQWIAPVNDFLALAVNDHRQERVRAEEAYRSKCVNGRYVPSPELHPLRSDDVDFPID